MYVFFAELTVVVNGSLEYIGNIKETAADPDIVDYAVVMDRFACQRIDAVGKHINIGFRSFHGFKVVHSGSQPFIKNIRWN